MRRSLLPMMKTDDRSERGQAAILALVALLFAGVLAAGLAQVGRAAAQRASAQAAADATALAGASAGRSAADDVAAANDAQVVAYRVEDVDVLVTVERRGASATARARWVPTPIP